MTEIRVDISELKVESGEAVKELVNFLREKTGTKVETTANEIILNAEGSIISKKHLRVFLRKYLHKAELKEYFRVISGKENTLIIKKKKGLESEE
ncbi:MAG: 60S ribosomal protein L22 [Candidatus Bathyarchaeia archaeon]